MAQVKAYLYIKLIYQKHNNMNNVFKTNNKPLWLIIAAIFILVALLFVFKYFVSTPHLSNAEIDQLVMQATYGQDPKSVEKLTVAAESQQVEAQLALGKILLFKHKAVQAIPFLNTAAKAGSRDAVTILGKIYFNGDKQIAKDYKLAMQWFNLAYQQHDPTAAYYLGLMYKNGYGTQIQSTQAVKYFEFAAKNNIPSAMFMLANAYQFGDGSNVDLKQAVHWYKAAADLELPEAIQELAHIYQYGNEAVHADQTAYQQQLLEIGHSLKHPAIAP